MHILAAGKSFADQRRVRSRILLDKPQQESKAFAETRPLVFVAGWTGCYHCKASLPIPDKQPGIFHALMVWTRQSEKIEVDKPEQEQEHQANDADLPLHPTNIINWCPGGLVRTERTLYFSRLSQHDRRAEKDTARSLPYSQAILIQLVQCLHSTLEEGEDVSSQHPPPPSNSSIWR